MKFEIKEKVIQMPKDYEKSPDENKVTKVESFAIRYYKEKGYNIIKSSEYDILSDANNRKPEIREGILKIENFLECLNKENGLRLKILKEIRKIQGKNDVKGQPDLFLYKNENDWFFAEIKSDKDKLSDGQKKMFALLKTILNCELEKNIKLIKVTTKENYGEPKTERFIVKFDVTDMERNS